MGIFFFYRLSKCFEIVALADAAYGMHIGEVVWNSAFDSFSSSSRLLGSIAGFRYSRSSCASSLALQFFQMFCVKIVCISIYHSQAFYLIVACWDVMLIITLEVI